MSSKTFHGKKLKMGRKRFYFRAFKKKTIGIIDISIISIILTAVILTVILTNI